MGRRGNERRREGRRGNEGRGEGGGEKGERGEEGGEKAQLSIHNNCALAGTYAHLP